MLLLDGGHYWATRPLPGQPRPRPADGDAGQAGAEVAALAAQAAWLRDSLAPPPGGAGGEARDPAGAAATAAAFSRVLAQQPPDFSVQPGIAFAYQKLERLPGQAALAWRDHPEIQFMAGDVDRVLEEWQEEMRLLLAPAAPGQPRRPRTVPPGESLLGRLESARIPTGSQASADSRTQLGRWALALAREQLAWLIELTGQQGDHVAGRAAATYLGVSPATVWTWRRTLAPGPDAPVSDENPVVRDAVRQWQEQVKRQGARREVPPGESLLGMLQTALGRMLSTKPGEQGEVLHGGRLMPGAPELLGKQDQWLEGQGFGVRAERARLVGVGGEVARRWFLEREGAGRAGAGAAAPAGGAAPQAGPAPPPPPPGGSPGPGPGNGQGRKACRGRGPRPPSRPPRRGAGEAEADRACGHRGAMALQPGPAGGAGAGRGGQRRAAGRGRGGAADDELAGVAGP